MKIKSRFNNLSKNKKISIVVVFIFVFLISSTVLGMQIARQIQIKNIEGQDFIEYITKAEANEEDFYHVVVKVNYKNRFR